MKSWFILFAAGIFEIGFTTFMKLSDGFTEVHYTIAFFVCALVSFYLLNRAVTVIPLGTAYAVWTGIGAFGTAIIGMLYFSDPVSWPRILLLMGLIGCILGLKMVAIIGA